MTKGPTYGSSSVIPNKFSQEKRSPSNKSGVQSPISYTAESKPSPAPSKPQGKAVNVMDAMTKANSKPATKAKAPAPK